MALSLLHANDAPGQYPASWYAATAGAIDSFPVLTGEQKFDIAIVGGGYSGLSTALHAAQRGYKVAVLEAHRVGWGASGRNGGQVSSGQRLDYHALEKLVGGNLARAAHQLGVEAAQLVRRLIETHSIECAYKEGIIEANHKARFDRESETYVEFMQRNLGDKSMTYLTREQLSSKLGASGYFGGILNRASGHLHPLNYAIGLAKAARKAGVEIFENSEVLEIASGGKQLLKTANGQLSSDWVVLACNGYLGNLNRDVAKRVMPINNFIIATEPLSEIVARSLIKDDEAVADSRFVVNYFRLSEDNRLLFGGGETYGYRFPTDISAFVRPKMLKIFPQLAATRIDYGWGGTLAITMNRVPDFCFVSDGIINLSGYSGSGVAMATMGGKIAAEAISGQMERFDIMAGLPTPGFPGGTLFRSPILAMAMLWYALRDIL